MKILKLIIIILCVTILLIEVFGLFIKNNRYFWENRFMYVGENDFRALEKGLWTFKPNSRIIDAATYKFSFSAPWIEYLCDFNTNQYGLVKTHLPNSNTKDIDLLVLGDSFTQGQGGCSWLNEKTTRDFKINVLNGGLQSTGISQFLLLEKYLSTQVNVKNVVLIAIPQDFFRGVGNYFIQQSRNCSKTHDCSNNLSYRWSVKENIPVEDQLLDSTNERYKSRYPDTSFSIFLREAAYYSLTLDLYFRYKGLLNNRVSIKENLFSDNLVSLEALVSKYPDMRVIILPEKPEVGILGFNSAQNKMVTDVLNARSIEYETCELGIDEFMPIDGHPNKHGYEKLYDCVFN